MKTPAENRGKRVVIIRYETGHAHNPCGTACIVAGAQEALDWNTLGENIELLPGKVNRDVVC